jgi:hypothetical protein
MPTALPVIEARPDGRLKALLQDLKPLRYRTRSDSTLGIPGHVRAASGIRIWGRRLAIIQDDVNLLAIQGEEQAFDAVLVPSASDDHGPAAGVTEDKKTKMDLEACLVLPDGRLAAFGSGSSPKRERVVVVDPEGRVRVRPAEDLYARLHETTAFSGSELNVEGALVVGQAVRLFQRCNGAPTAALKPVNATGDLPIEAFLGWLDGDRAAPPIERIRQYNLGQVGGVPYGFTDAALIPDGRIAFIAVAEDSPDAIQDGAIMGAVFGVMDDRDVRTTPIVDASGTPVKLKLEGIEFAAGGLNDSFLVVADMDNPDEPALLGRLVIRNL